MTKTASPGRNCSWAFASEISAAILLLIALALAVWGNDPARWREVFHQGAQLFNAARIDLGSTTHTDAIAPIFYPAIGMLVLAVALRLLFNRPPDCLRLPVGLVFFTLQIVYLAFRALTTLCLDSWANGTVSVLFFVSELFIHFRIALGNLSLLRLTNRSPQADESQRAVRAGEYLPSVDVFVPTYSEPVEMLRRTIIGCQELDYPRKTIYLLDDQRRPAMRALAKELGCEYFDRPDNRHAKAGNLNHAPAHVRRIYCLLRRGFCSVPRLH